MIKKILPFIFVFLLSFSATAQADDKKDVLNIVKKMFAEMANHNPQAIAELFTKEANLTALIKNKEGKTVARVFTGEQFSKNFAEKRGEIKEIMYAPKVETDGDLAFVWGRYVFFVNGKLSHCGVNSFDLIRTETGWKIANASSTILPDGCSAKEKKMKT